MNIPGLSRALFSADWTLLWELARHGWRLDKMIMTGALDAIEHARLGQT